MSENEKKKLAVFSILKHLSVKKKQLDICILGLLHQVFFAVSLLAFMIRIIDHKWEVGYY